MEGCLLYEGVRNALCLHANTIFSIPMLFSEQSVRSSRPLKRRFFSKPEDCRIWGFTDFFQDSRNSRGTGHMRVGAG
jgi:hypothetical protein